jgi:hypothetical protein
MPDTPSAPGLLERSAMPGEAGAPARPGWAGTVEGEHSQARLWGMPEGTRVNGHGTYR